VSKKEVVKSFFALLRDKYLQEILVIPSTILVIVIDSVNRNSFGLLDGIAILLLVAYLIYVLYDTQTSAIAITINLETGYSLCLGKSELEFADNLRKQKDVLHRKKINLSKVFSHYRVIDFDWQFHESSIAQPVEWKENISNINEHFLRYALRIPTETKLHLFLLSPCPIAIGLGFTIGKHRPWVVYHYDFPTSSYNAIEPIKLDSVNKDKYQHININETGSSQEKVMVVVSIIPKSSIPLPHLSERIIEITAKDPKPQTSDFASIASEIIDYLNEIHMQVKSVHLFPGMPIAMGFVVGKELNDQANIHIYNPNRTTNKWERVLSLHDLAI
jgi:hypothetical protein